MWCWSNDQGVALPSGYKVRIDDRRGVMPDIQYFRHENPALRDPAGVSEGTPDLAVEVISPSSGRYDRITKHRYYASIGLPEYWLVDPELQTLERMVLRDGHFTMVESLSGDEVFRPESFPSLEVPLAQLWTPPAKR
ncbi:MAG: hypothetical protein RL199_546 [Pseudomonadota bacterium]|jgi:Uma2 family endonuclease